MSDEVDDSRVVVSIDVGRKRTGIDAWDVDGIRKRITMRNAVGRDGGWLAGRFGGVVLDTDPV